MCVWEAAKAMQVGSNQPRHLRDILRELSFIFASLQEASIHATGNDFDRLHPGPEITFKEYCHCIRYTLLDQAQSFDSFVRAIELKCWEKCEAAYTKKTVRQKYGCTDVVFKLWQIFNRLAVDGSFPPVVLKSEITWFLNRLVEGLPDAFILPVESEKYTFPEFITQLTTWTLQGADSIVIKKCVEEAHSWLVDEVLNVGWLNKRTRKRSNSSFNGWTKRWCVLTPGFLKYYDGPSLNCMKGCISVTSRSSILKTTGTNSVFKWKQHRIRLENINIITIELASPKEESITKWNERLVEAKSAAAQGTTPVSLLLMKRRSSNVAEEQFAEEQLKKRLLRFRSNTQKSITATARYKLGKRTGSVEDESGNVSSCESQNSDEEFDNDIVKEQKMKLHSLFAKLDTNGNGFIDYDEFCTFTRQCGLDLDNENNRIIFDSIDSDKNNKIDFEELNDYFMTVVMNDDSSNLAHQSLGKAFWRASKMEGKDTLNFREFTELAAKRRQSIRMSKLLHAFDELVSDENGEVKMIDFKNYMDVNGMLNKRKSTKSTKSFIDSEDGVNKYLRKVYEETDMEDLALYIRKRWTAFASFKRYGKDNKLVMIGDHGMKRDVFPGKYSLIDLACFSDLDPLEPRHATVQGVRWISSTVNNKPGQLIFPSTFGGRIPTEVATSELLRYYECTIADANQEKISLIYRHGIQDFTYGPKYFHDYVIPTDYLGGAGLEKHAFSHLDCPLDDDAGHFVLAKFVGGDLHLTAFNVPKRHTVYVPPNVIHSNDYLQGTWRTMLSDEAHIDLVQLMKPDLQQNMLKFSLNF